MCHAASSVITDLSFINVTPLLLATGNTGRISKARGLGGSGRWPLPWVELSQTARMTPERRSKDAVSELSRKFQICEDGPGDTQEALGASPQIHAQCSALAVSSL